MKNISVRMFRDDMEDIPVFPFPKGFYIRNYRISEGHIWERIQQSVEPHRILAKYLFLNEFGSEITKVEDRVFFIITDDGTEIGTITAWWNLELLEDKKWGMIHWVAVYPDYQGRGLAKAAMTIAMERLKQSHERVVLRTYSGSIAAIKVYLDFGFYPDLGTENSQEAWTEVASILTHETLKDYGF